MKKASLASVLRCMLILLVATSLSGIFDLDFGRVHAQQCVKCTVMAGCRACLGNGDADACSTDCETCILTGVCPPNPDLSLTDGSCEPGTTTNFNDKSFKIPVETIREIGKVHPRFAVTLAKINRIGVNGRLNNHLAAFDRRFEPDFSKIGKNGFRLGTTYRVFWSPIDIGPIDVEKYLSSESYNNPSRDVEVKTINDQIERGVEQDVFYRITVEKLDATTIFIKLQVERGFLRDPGYSTLEIKHISTETDIGVSEPAIGKIVWSVY